MSMAVRGQDGDIALLMNLRKFIEEERMYGRGVLHGSRWSTAGAQTFSNDGEGEFQ